MIASIAMAAALAVTPPDPCKLVDRGDAGRALGVPIVELKLAVMGPSRTCTLRTKTLLRSVVVTAYRWNTPAEAHARFGELVSQASKRMSPSGKIAGLGDEAESIASNVYVRKGADAFVFNVIDGTVGPARTARTILLANRTLARAR